MTYHNFMFADVVAITQAFLLYGLFLFVPGYVISAALNILEFRSQTLFEKCITAVAVSCALSPVLAYLIWTIFSLTAVWIAFATLWCGYLFLIFRKLFSQNRALDLGMSRSSWMILALGSAWMLVALFSLLDMQFGDRLYRSVTDFDHCMRTAVVSAISRSGLPPRTPFFFPGHPVALRSHYFWLVLSSLVQLLSMGRVSARDAMLASPLWCGLALLATICLYQRFFFADPRKVTDATPVLSKPVGWQRKSVIAGALVAVTGLDILPTIYFYLTQHVTYADMEWWNEQVTSWFDSMLWVPHHVAALLAGLTGFLIVFRKAASINRSVVLAVIAGLAFACCTGTSVYVGFVFAIFATCWCIALLLERSWHELGALLLAGIIALACLLPFITEVSSTASGGSFIEFHVRGFRFVDDFLVGHRFSAPWLIEPGTVFSAHILFMPVNYFFEFGFFFLVGLWRLRRYKKYPRHRTRTETCGLIMFATGLLISMFLRSSAISNNDLGWRSCLLVQFIALLWAADFLLALFSGKRLSGTAKNSPAVWFSWRVIAYVCLALGLAGSIYQVVVLRYYAPLVDAHDLQPIEWLAPDAESGKRSYAVREAYEWLRKNIPSDAIEQHNPAIWYDDPFWGMYGDRQVIANNSACDTALGGNPTECAGVAQPLMNLFRNPGLDAQQARSVCRQFMIDVLVVKDRDPIWRSPDSWVWHTAPLFANNYVRVFGCR